MLPVIIHGLDDTLQEMVMSHLQELSETQKSAFINFKLVTASHSEEETASAIRRTAGITLFIVSMVGATVEQRKAAMRLSELANKQNRDNYIIYVLPSSSMLLDWVPNFFMPTGIWLHPVTEEQITKTLRRVVDDFSLLNMKDGDKPSPFVILRYLGSLIRLNPSTITHIEARDKKLQIYQPKDDIAVYETMNGISKQLDGRFFHCHRSYMVNCDYIKRIDIPGLELELFDGTRIPISRSYRSQAIELMQMLSNGTPAAAQ